MDGRTDCRCWVSVLSSAETREREQEQVRIRDIGQRNGCWEWRSTERHIRAGGIWSGIRAICFSTARLSAHIPQGHLKHVVKRKAFPVSSPLDSAKHLEFGCRRYKIAAECPGDSKRRIGGEGERELVRSLTGGYPAVKQMRLRERERATHLSISLLHAQVTRLWEFLHLTKAT